MTATAAGSLAALLAGALLGAPAPIQAQTAATAADSAGITRAALDYIEGWYAGDAARMERALHPELAKRMVYRPAKAGARPQLDQQSAMTLVQHTRAGGGKDTPKDKQQKDVTILVETSRTLAMSPSMVRMRTSLCWRSGDTSLPAPSRVA